MKTSPHKFYNDRIFSYLFHSDH
jgi:hypothetical protein